MYLNDSIYFVCKSQNTRILLDLLCTFEIECDYPIVVFMFWKCQRLYIAFTTLVVSVTLSKQKRII